MDEVSKNLRGHGGVVINTASAERLGIEEGDLVEVRSYLHGTKGPAILRQGIRPDTLLMIGQFDHWVTPYAKDMKAPSMNALVPMSIELTDATGSAADLVRVSVRRVAA
jgi:phenylacetyl-CoA:acceptor oxidoreductase